MKASTEIRDALILAAFEAGTSPLELASKFNITQRRLGDIVRYQRMVRGLKTGNWTGVRNPPAMSRP